MLVLAAGGECAWNGEEDDFLARPFFVGIVGDWDTAGCDARVFLLVFDV